MSCWICGATGGASGSTHFSTGDAIDSDAHAVRLDLRAHLVYFGVAVIDDVPAVDDAKLGERHAEPGHRRQRAIEIVWREFVGDRTDLEEKVPGSVFDEASAKSDPGTLFT